MPAMTAPFVQTVLGPINPAELGMTLTHEHLVIDWSLARGQTQTPVQSKAAVDRVLSCVKRASDAGVDAIVDVGTEIYGPSPLFLLAVALQVPVRIVWASGIFTADQLPIPGWACPPAGPEDVAARFVLVATEGRDGSGVKPGALKVATGGRCISELEETIVRGAVIAQRRTGLAIITHNQGPAHMEHQVDILEDAGADLDRVSIGHIGWMSGAEDFALNERLARRGVMIALDCIGGPTRSDEEYARIALDLIEAGYASQLLLSHDGAGYVRGIQGAYEREWFGGDWTIVPARFIGLLRSGGVDDATIRQITVDNPRRLLTIDPARYPGTTDTLLRPVVDHDLDWLTGEQSEEARS